MIIKKGNVSNSKMLFPKQRDCSPKTEGRYQEKRAEAKCVYHIMEICPTSD